MEVGEGQETGVGMNVCMPERRPSTETTEPTAVPVEATAGARLLSRLLYPPHPGNMLGGSSLVVTLWSRWLELHSKPGKFSLCAG